MCGIWGFVGQSTTVPVADAWDGLCSITDRGPDDWGMYLNGEGKVTEEAQLPHDDRRIVLGNRRLSILDLSAAGNQPMGSENEQWIVYNGEVYNYRELREDLTAAGYEFESDTDTEVILRAYQEYGEACLDRFRGMFAFVIYDANEKILFGARDRFGIKPLYYDHSDGRLGFSSEVTALLEGGIADQGLDPKGVDGFLALGYVPQPRTILESVRSVPPASMFSYDIERDDLTIDRYWTPTFGEVESATADRIRELLRESVKLRLRSDVPVGAFLSGGLDSTTIVALMREMSEADREDLHTFSVGLDYPAYSETDFAESAAAEFETVHTSKTITATDVRDGLGDIIDAMDQPTIDGVNTYFVSKVTAESGLKVALSGLGSDELFRGYPSFKTVGRRYRIMRAVKRLPQSVRKLIAATIDRVSPIVPTGPLGKVSDAVRSNAPYGASYLTVRGIFGTSERRNLLNDEFEPHDWAKAIEDDVKQTVRGTGLEDGVSQTELYWYMHNQLLRDTDVMSMSHSLEVRVPFLDTSLADYLTSCSIDSFEESEKGLLKQAMKDIIPLEIIERKKSGFTLPFDEWLRDELANVVDEALSVDRLARTPIDYEESANIKQAFSRERIHWSRLWAVVVLSLWIDRHL